MVSGSWKNCFCCSSHCSLVSVSPRAVRPCDILPMVVNISLRQLREYSPLGRLMRTIRRIILSDRRIVFSQGPHEPNQLVSAKSKNIPEGHQPAKCLIS